MTQAPREPDPRLCDWVDGALSPREQERFAAELRVNPQLRADLAAYQRTVDVARQALAELRSTDDRPSAEGERMAAAVLARLAAPGRAAAQAAHWSPSRWLLGGTLAAALLAAAVWIDRWGGRLAAPEAVRVAEGGTAPTPTEVLGVPQAKRVAVEMPAPTLGSSPVAADDTSASAGAPAEELAAGDRGMVTQGAIGGAGEFAEREQAELHRFSSRGFVGGVEPPVGTPATPGAVLPRAEAGPGGDGRHGGAAVVVEAAPGEPTDRTVAERKMADGKVAVDNLDKGKLAQATLPDRKVAETGAGASLPKAERGGLYLQPPGSAEPPTVVAGATPGTGQVDVPASQGDVPEREVLFGDPGTWSAALPDTGARSRRDGEPGPAADAERLPELRLRLPVDAAAAETVRAAIVAETTSKAAGDAAAGVTWLAFVADSPRTGSDDFFLGATRRADSFEAWVVEGSQAEVGALLGRLAELAKRSGMAIAQGEAVVSRQGLPPVAAAGGGGVGGPGRNGVGGPAGPASAGPNQVGPTSGGPSTAGPSTAGPGPAPNGPSTGGAAVRGAPDATADAARRELPKPGGGRGTQDGPQAPGAPTRGAPIGQAKSKSSPEAVAAKPAEVVERVRIVVRLVPPSDKR